MFVEEEAQAGDRMQEGLPVKFLVQGTLYPDVIESISVKGPSAVIKTHHNVGGLPKNMPFELIEPLRDLVQRRGAPNRKGTGVAGRNSGEASVSGSGISRADSWRDNSARNLEILRGADAVVVDEIRRAGLYEKVWQAFAVLLPVQQRGRDGRRPHLCSDDRGRARG